MVTLSDTYAGCGEFSAEAATSGFSPVKNVNSGGRKVLLNGQWGRLDESLPTIHCIVFAVGLFDDGAKSG
jgi:hypothetical protein